MNICAGIVVEKAKNIGLNVMYNNITPMDGNCWYHSIREAMLGNGLDFDGYVDHVELRVAVVNFVNSGRDMDFRQAMGNSKSYEST